MQIYSNFPIITIPFALWVIAYIFQLIPIKEKISQKSTLSNMLLKRLLNFYSHEIPSYSNKNMALFSSLDI